MPPRPLIRARGLGVRYFTRRTPALRDVSLACQPGERILLAGPSGAGKSTLALCLAGLIPGSLDAEVTGRVEVDGMSTAEAPPGSLAQRIGTVFQDPASQFTLLSVEDEVAFGLENLGVPAGDMPSRVGEALTAVGLADRAAWRIDRLSGGQQQRVALAAALATRPAALVLDEPTAHLDPRSATEVYARVRLAADQLGTALLVVEHDLDRVVPGLVDRCVLLAADGGVAADADVATLFADASRARRWADLGVWLPASVTLALALEGPSLREVPLGVGAAARWLAARPWAQHALQDAAAREAATRPTPGEPVLRAAGLAARYATPAGSITALQNIDVDLRAGEMLAIVGASGSGKSTLLRVLGGLLRPWQGRVSVEGIDLYRTPAREAARLVAHVFQNPEAGFVADTVADEIAYGPRALGWPAAEVRQHSANLLEQFGLVALARANPFTLSEGQKRRLSVASALVLGPRVLLLDEPTFGQDRRSAQTLLAEVSALRARGLAVVVATHDLSLVVEEADHVLALVDGRLLSYGVASSLVADERTLALAGQERPPLARILDAARHRGAEVPPLVRWKDLARPRPSLVSR